MTNKEKEAEVSELLQKPPVKIPGKYVYKNTTKEVEGMKMERTVSGAIYARLPNGTLRRVNGKKAKRLVELKKGQ